MRTNFPPQFNINSYHGSHKSASIERKQYIVTRRYTSMFYPSIYTQQTF